jgi:hypothetical protein
MTPDAHWLMDGARAIQIAVKAVAILGAVAALWYALFVGPASGSARLPRLLGDASHWRLTWQVRPANILYTGDSSAILGGSDGTGIAHPGHLAWKTWTPHRATASGADWIDDCKNGCHDGNFIAHAVTVEAFRPVRGHFTRLTLRYRYQGKRRVELWGIRPVGGSWGFYIVALRA